MTRDIERIKRRENRSVTVIVLAGLALAFGIIYFGLAPRI